jgi:uncharacterized membrane protein (Fun14 family)
MSEAYLLFLLKTVAIGLALGVVAGFLVKKIAKIIVIVAVVVIAALLLLVYNGAIAVEGLSFADGARRLIERDIEAESAGEALLRIVKINLPFSLAVAAGFFVGATRG